VPSLPDASKVHNGEISAIKEKTGFTDSLLESIKIEEKQCVIEDAHFDEMKSLILTSIKEAVLWIKSTDSKDPRLDNISGVILSRFI
jgi:hypothetical protein